MKRSAVFNTFELEMSKPKLPKDAWGMPLYYAYPNSKDPNSSVPAIWSSGPNKQNEEGAGDDINNWDNK